MRGVGCRCDCGNVHRVPAKLLAQGAVRSCGRCRDATRNVELAARLDGIRAAVGELLPDLGTVGHALIVLTGCAPDVLTTLEAAGGLRVTRDGGVDLVHFDGPRVSIRVNAKGSPTT